MVSWSEFERLPGSAEDNFELLCRSLIILQYGRYGQLDGLANQPGVEFHLRVNSSCTLGDAGRWFGWQCKWYNLQSGKALGSARRRKIEEALTKTVAVLPEVTDWVLWTRRPLTKEDQTWFHALKRTYRLSLQLHLWTADNIETLLPGEAEMLRQTYFGDLILTPHALSRLHHTATEKIRKRWLPEVHQTVNTERTVRKMLGEAASWDDLLVVARRLQNTIRLIGEEPAAFSAKLKSSVTGFVEVINTFAGALERVYAALSRGEFSYLRQLEGQISLTISRETACTPSRLRSANLACGLDATNALADMQLAPTLIANVEELLGKRLVGVLADAGGGKTQFAAQISAETNRRSAGILLHGYDLHSGQTLDDLVKRIVVNGKPVTTIEGLIAALDAAGQRAKCRLPLVIDGLNEAEDPRDWKGSLASLNAILNQFGHILVICTMRTGSRRPKMDEPFYDMEEDTQPPGETFADQSLPDDVERLEIPSFEEDTPAAIHKYFQHFRIESADADLPLDLLSHPLTLRIFCEVTNTERTRTVGVESMPGSLSSMFELYVRQAAERIAELAPRSHRYYPHDVANALDVLGMTLWDSRRRDTSELEIRKALHDDGRPWNESIIHLLEQEGLVLRTPSNISGQQNIIPVYDALGGYIIAKALVGNHGRVGLERWLSEPATSNSLGGETPVCHPLALDVFRALACLVPRYPAGRVQLWQIVDEPLRATALLLTVDLEARYLDEATIAALAKVIQGARPGTQAIFRRMLSTRAVPQHPLNTDFLDAALRILPVAKRDLLWSEWIYRNKKRVLDDIDDWENKWRSNQDDRGLRDRLQARWLTWLSTSTIQNLRDRVTRALYFFGLRDSDSLFEFTERAAELNDPYVYERLLTAYYGTAMALHSQPDGQMYRQRILPAHARRLYSLMFAPNAPGRTTHQRTREYGRRFIELAEFHHRKLFDAKERKHISHPGDDGGRIQWPDVETSAERYIVGSPFDYEFENYGIGRLVDDRGSYDFEHAGYRQVRSQLLWRVNDFGWDTTTFASIDRRIAEENRRYVRDIQDHYKTDLYGEKYSKIAYQELAGWRRDHGLLSDRREHLGRSWDVDIDPSFPTANSETRLINADFLGDSNLSLPEWIQIGPTPDFGPYYKQQSVHGEQGPWIALDGYVAQQDGVRGRRLFAFLRSFLISTDEAKQFSTMLAKQPLGGRWLPEKPELLYIYSGEYPWCKCVPAVESENIQLISRERKTAVERVVQRLYLDGDPIETSPFARTIIESLRQGYDKDDDRRTAAFRAAVVGRIEIREERVSEDKINQPFRIFKTIIPAYDVGWENRTVEMASSRGVTLAKKLALRDCLKSRGCGGFRPWQA